MFRSEVFGDREIAAGGLEVLADGGDVDILLTEVAKELFDFGGSFAEADHEAGLCHDIGAVGAGEAKNVERLPVVCLGTHAAIEAWGCLHIVVEDVGGSVEDAGDGDGVAFEIGGEDFDAGVRERKFHVADGFGEVRGAAVVQIVTIDAGDDDVAEVHFGGHAGDIGGFGGVEAHVV